MSDESKVVMAWRPKKERVCDQVTVFCNHKEECSAKCENMKSAAEAKACITGIDDIAYVENRHCDRFRGAEKVKGADIQELGVWN